MKKLNKSIALILAVVLVVGGIVGTTMAWLIDSTDDVVNTFTYGDIDVELDETKRDPNGDTVDEDKDGQPDRTPEGNDYEMMPGAKIEKDPEVRVLAGSEDCWLFVKLEEKGGATIGETTYGFDDYLSYEVMDDEGQWTQLLDANGEAVEGVYYRPVWSNEEVQKFGIIEGNTVVVKDSVTKEMLNALDPEGQAATYPQLVITAYAVQYVGFESANTDDVAANNTAALNAWAEAVKATTVTTPEGATEPTTEPTT